MTDQPYSLSPRQDPEIVRKVLAHAAYQAVQSRKDPAAFFQFVMKEETTRARMCLMPHQKIIFDFVMMHEKCILMLPVGHSKTFCMSGLSMWLLGHNPTTRGVVVSSTETQAEKVLKQVKSYIEESPELKLVFPYLKKSPNPADSWTQTEITVARPPGIRDHSLMALGIGSKRIQGSRINWVLADDLLTFENTESSEQRQKVYEWFDSSILSRLDPKGAKVVITQTAWHSKDLIHTLRDQGWPTLKMGAYGEIRIYNSDFGCEGFPGADDLRDTRRASVDERGLVNPEEFHCRLTAHDPDPFEIVPLWPERYSREYIDSVKDIRDPKRFAQSWLNDVRDLDTMLCQPNWIERCKVRGLSFLRHQYTGNNLTFTGVDLAVNAGEAADSTAFFTIEIVPSGKRRILDIEIGKFNGPTIVQKVIDKAKLYKSVVMVENNGAQDFIRQWVRTVDNSVPIRPYTTGRTKARADYGVPSIFNELERGAWEIPCNEYGEMNKPTNEWVNGCYDYTPSKHTADVLMACFFALQGARQFGVGIGPQVGTNGGGAGIGNSIMSR